MSIGILPNVNSLKMNRDAKQGDKCLFPHFQVEGQPSRKPKKSCKPQNGKSDDKGAVAIVKVVPQLGLVRIGSIGFSHRGKSVSGKPDAKSLGNYSKNTIHSVYATPSKFP